jgi:hypothetical protein
MAVLTIPGLSVVLDSYQWNYVAGRQFGSRNEAVSDYGVLVRELTGTVQRTMTVRFTQIDTKLEALRALSMRAGRSALPVTFTDETGMTWIVDWPSDIEFRQVMENRREIELTLLEQSPGA